MWIYAIATLQEHNVSDYISAVRYRSFMSKKYRRSSKASQGQTSYHLVEGHEILEIHV